MLLVAGVFLRALLLAFHRIVETDGAAYLHIARALKNGEGFTPWGEHCYLIWSPLYSASIALVTFFIEDYEFAARSLSFLAGIGAIAIVAYLGLHLFSLRTGLLAAFLVSLSPSLISSSTAVMTESLFTFLSVLSAALALNCLYRFRPFTMLGLGCCIGAMCLVRAEGIFTGLGLLFILSAFGEKSKWGLASLSLVVVPFAAFVFSNSALVFSHTGEWTFSTKIKNNWYVGQAVYESAVSVPEVKYGLDEDLEVVGTDRFPSPSPLQAIARDTEYFLKKYIANSVIIFEELCSSLGVLGFFSLIGVYTMLRKGEFLSLTFLVSLMLPLLVYPLFYVQPRNVQMLLPAFHLMAARPFVGVPYQLALSLAAVIGLYPFVRDLDIAINVPERHAVEHRRAGELLRSEVTRNDIIMSTKPFIAFYSGARPAVLPFAEPADVISYAKSKGISLMAIDTRYVSTHRQPLRPLLNPLFAENLGLKLIKVFDTDKSRPIYLYEIELDEAPASDGSSCTSLF